LFNRKLILFKHYRILFNPFSILFNLNTILFNPRIVDLVQDDDLVQGRPDRPRPTPPTDRARGGSSAVLPLPGASAVTCVFNS